MPGKELICRWFKQCIRSQSSALLLPTASLATKTYDLFCPGFACILFANWPETHVGYLTTDIGKILCLWVRGMCQIPLLWSKCVSASRRWGENCCFQLQGSSVLLQWFAPGSGSHSYFCNCNSQKFFLKIKAIISRAWFMVGGLSMAAEFGKESLSVQQSRLCPQSSSHHTGLLLFCLFLWDISVEHLMPHIVVHTPREMNSPPLCPVGPVFCLMLGEAWLSFLPAHPQGCWVVFGGVLRLIGLHC